MTFKQFSHNFEVLFNQDIVIPQHLMYTYLISVLRDLRLTEYIEPKQVKVVTLENTTSATEKQYRLPEEVKMLYYIEDSEGTPLKRVSENNYFNKEKLSVKHYYLKDKTIYTSSLHNEIRIAYKASIPRNELVLPDDIELVNLLSYGIAYRYLSFAYNVKRIGSREQVDGLRNTYLDLKTALVDSEIMDKYKIVLRHE